MHTATRLDSGLREASRSPATEFSVIRLRAMPAFTSMSTTLAARCLESSVLISSVPVPLSAYAAVGVAGDGDLRIRVLGEDLADAAQLEGFLRPDFGLADDEEEVVIVGFHGSGGNLDFLHDFLDHFLLDHLLHDLLDHLGLGRNIDGSRGGLRGGAAAEAHLHGEAEAPGGRLHEVVDTLVVGTHVGGHFRIERGLEVQHGEVVAHHGEGDALDPGAALTQAPSFFTGRS